MRIVSWNLNGIRAAIRKGLDDFISLLDADIWMFQEVRAFPEQLPKDWESPNGYDLAWHPAEKKGYSGVSTWSKVGMNVIGTGMGIGDDLDDFWIRCTSPCLTGFFVQMLPIASALLKLNEIRIK